MNILDTYIKGMDISTLPEVEACGGKFFDSGKENDLLAILKSYGTNSVRLRVWNDPYSVDGKPYGAGTNDLNTYISLAKRAKEQGMSILLDLHYSDFWADPGKQFIPKAWENDTKEELEKHVYEFTKEVLEAASKENAMPDMIQVGNELSNGFLWPLGKVPNYDNLADFINAGIKAIRDFNSSIPIMLHLDNGGNNKLYRTWFDEFIKRGEDFDVIGLSYYPFWHGSMKSLADNMNDIALRYHKKLVIAEVSMGFTMDDYSSYEGLGSSERNGMATKENLVYKIEHPMTKDGQCEFMKDLFKVIEDVPEGLGKGFYYWEAGWIPVKGSAWSTEEGRDYIHEPGKGGNEWANQALFDFEGNALPALHVIRSYQPI